VELAWADGDLGYAYVRCHCDETMGIDGTCEDWKRCGVLK